TRAQADLLDAEVQELLPAIGAQTVGRFLHGDLARMHVFIEPERGNLTDFIDWGDLQVGDPVWELAIAACHFASLYPHLIDGYRADSAVTERIAMLGDFYLAYRQAWVARLGPSAGGRTESLSHDAASGS